MVSPISPKTSAKKGLKTAPVAANVAPRTTALAKRLTCAVDFCTSALELFAAVGAGDVTYSSKSETSLTYGAPG